ncbi:MAG: DUF2207 domain-containing protein [Burkholderiales bacterium]|nr:DUF2207 domain-containing protein [Burkholderiales bacterium]
MEIADKRGFEFKYTGGKIPELFERILPYAIALGLEQQWSRQFAKGVASCKTTFKLFSFT